MTKNSLVFKLAYPVALKKCSTSCATVTAKNLFLSIAWFLFSAWWWTSALEVIMCIIFQTEASKTIIKCHVNFKLYNVLLNSFKDYSTMFSLFCCWINKDNVIWNVIVVFINFYSLIIWRINMKNVLWYNRILIIQWLNIQHYLCTRCNREVGRHGEVGYIGLNMFHAGALRSVGVIFPDRAIIDTIIPTKDIIDITAIISVFTKKSTRLYRWCINWVIAKIRLIVTEIEVCIPLTRTNSHVAVSYHTVEWCLLKTRPKRFGINGSSTATSCIVFKQEMCASIDLHKSRKM